MTTFNAEKYLISLLRHCLGGELPPAPQDFDGSALLKLAKFHSVANIAYYALEKQEILPSEQRAEWSEIRDRALMCDILQLTEFEQLCEAFQRENIRFIPLKGILMKTLYPQSDYRSMSDIDLLIDENNAEKVKQVMISLGYEVDSEEVGVHDVYHKKPAVSIEVHRDLFGDDGQEFAPLFTDPWSKCEKRSDTWYEFTEEYFFAYLLAHGIKHYQLGGTGIRTFMDVALYREHCGDKLDIEQIYKMFESVGARKICEDFIALSEVWFGGKTPDDSLTAMEQYIIRGGTYGTYENHVEFQLKSKSKLGYVFSRLFPSLKHMKLQYPVLRKAPVLLPFMWIFRILTKPFINHRQTAAKLKALTKK